MRGREVTTLEGLASAGEWAERFSAHGASQCGFCTPGIIMRLASLSDADRRDEAKVRKALLGHLCRCTGWQPIIDAATSDRRAPTPPGVNGRSEVTAGLGPAADRRATIEGRAAQTVGVEAALGRGGFADDGAPDDAQVALRSVEGEWQIAPTVADARVAIGKVQGRRTTTPIAWPVELPAGDFDRILQTTWVEPAYLEPDASWCDPAATPTSCLGNGGAFGGKCASPVEAVAARLATDAGQPVRALYSREDVVVLGPKRPPVAIGMNADGSGVVRVASTGTDLDLAAIAQRWPNLRFETVAVDGPPVSLDIRAAVETEIRVVAASFQDGPDYRIATPDGAVARASVGADHISVTVECGDPLDAVVLSSYCSGAAHMGYSMVMSEAIRLDDDGVPTDLTIRSFGIVRAVDTPPISVTVTSSDAEPVNGSDAVFAAVAAATWGLHGWPARWPIKAL